jgi:sugar/nucleoside kinase (ribokinase family)
MSAKPIHILCIGLPVRDLTFNVQAVPGRGQKFHADKFAQICGGNALNAAIGINRLGGKASLTGPMGDAGETASKYIFEDLAKEGIDTTHLIHMPGLVTPISGIMMDPSGERTIISFRDPALWKVKLPDHDLLLKDCDAILIESRCAGFATDLCHDARTRGIPVVVDIDSTISQSEGLLTASSHLIFSDEALQSTAGVADNLKALQKMATLTSSFLAVTRGPKGTLWLDEQNQPHETPAFPVHVVDTLGAGDIFHGAFALEFAAGKAIPDALRFASAAAALKCTRYGGAFACPQRTEVEELLAHPRSKA